VLYISRFLNDFPSAVRGSSNALIDAHAACLARDGFGTSDIVDRPKARVRIPPFWRALERLAGGLELLPSDLPLVRETLLTYAFAHSPSSDWASADAGLAAFFASFVR
jgi:hypothetical protein